MAHKELSDFVEAYGNVYRGYKYIAVRFKKPIVYIRNLNHITPDFFQSPCVVVFESIIPSEKQYLFSKSVLVFVVQGDVNSWYIPVKSKCETDLLQSLFKMETILYSTFFNNTLFVLTTENPFVDFWHLLRKNYAFHALVQLSVPCIRQEDLSIQQCMQMRFFKRNSCEWKKWFTWYPFVYNLVQRKFIAATGSFPNAHCATLLNKAFKNSLLSVYNTGNLSDFYVCEITFDETKLTGILYQTLSERRVVYVSPMVTSFHQTTYLDVNRQECNRWLPFYYSREMWLKDGFRIYASNFKLNCIHLKQILQWLSTQTAEKYHSMTRDLQIVKRILIGL